MTPARQPHCDHECKCFVYLGMMESTEKEPCVCNICEDNTRTHSSTTTAPPYEQYILKVLKVLGDAREEILERLSSPFSIEVIKEMQDITREHDAAIAKAERERVLDAAIATIQNGIDGMPEFIIPEVRQGKIDACEWIIEKLESLRGSGAP